MSLFPTQHNIKDEEEFDVGWTLCRSGHTSAQMIPPSDHTLKIRFMFYKETVHTFTPDRIAQEYCMIPESSTKAITVCPSELLNHDATSIVRTPSGRMLVDFINTHFPSEDIKFLSQILAKITNVVKNSIESETKGFVDVQRRNRIEIMHLLHDKAVRASMHRYFEATKYGTCAICMDDFEIGRHSGSGIRLPCLHAFHGNCIYKRLLMNPHCPVCKYACDADLVPLFNTPLQEGIWMLHSTIGEEGSELPTVAASKSSEENVGIRFRGKKYPNGMISHEQGYESCKVHVA